jgi:AcrR family transcriptional regulator
MTETSATLRQRLRETAAEAMLDSAERAMLKKGYERATMQDIASAAGCATGTFYLYFKNKEELLQAIVARHATAMFGGARAAMDAADAPLQKLHAATVAMVRYFNQNKQFFRLFFMAMPLRHRAMHQKLGTATRQHHDDYTRLELDLIRRAQKQGEIRADLPADLLQDFMMSCGMSIIERFVFDEEPPSIQQQVRILWGLIVGGIGAADERD